MKYCVYCGAEQHDEAIICVKCGRSVAPTLNPTVPSPKDNTLVTICKVFLILSCIAQGWLLLPLAWCLPITISICNKMKNNEPVGAGLKVCALLFVNLIGGILLLCRSDEK